MGSSRNPQNKILGMSPQKIEKLLVDWVNLPKDLGRMPRPGPVERMLSRYPEVFAEWQDLRQPAGQHTAFWQMSAEEHSEWCRMSTKHSELFMYLVQVRDGLQQAWDAPNSRHRDWHVFIMRQAAHQARVAVENMSKPDSEKLSDRWKGVPDATPFESAMVYFQETIRDRAKHCAGPDCPVPYFIAVKRWQKFCSEKCAGPANRESKRKWWREHRGNEGE